MWRSVYLFIARLNPVVSGRLAMVGTDSDGVAGLFVIGQLFIAVAVVLLLAIAISQVFKWAKMRQRLWIWIQSHREEVKISRHWTDDETFVKPSAGSGGSAALGRRHRR
jgi:hypothetical protein